MTYSFLHLLMLGGPAMGPLVLCSIIAVAIIAERFVTLARAQMDTRRFLEEIAAIVKRNKVSEALTLCERTQGPIARLVRVGLLKQGRSREEIRQAIEEAGHREVPALECHLAALGTIAHIAPLLGLLGTTLGLIRCFHVIQAKALLAQPVGPGDVAQGIWQALLTTATGLLIAIPVIVAYNYFIRRVQYAVWEMETATHDVLGLLTGEGA